MPRKSGSSKGRGGHPKTQHKSAKTGQYVTERFAKRNPSTTYKTTSTKGGQGRGKK